VALLLPASAETKTTGHNSLLLTAMSKEQRAKPYRKGIQFSFSFVGILIHKAALEECWKGIL